MSSQTSTKWTRTFWFVAIAACLGVAACGLVLQTQAVTLEREHNALLAELRDKQRRKQRLGDLVTQVRGIQVQQSSEMKELKQLHERITTGEQFLVTSGDKIVRQLAAHAPSSERRLLFYVPSGDHRLVYAMREFLGTTTETYSALTNWGNDHRRTQDATEIPLVGDTVYALRTVLKKGVDSSIGIQLIGPGDKVVHEDSLPLSYVAFQGLGNWQNDSEVFATYPNEIRSAGDAKNHVAAARSAPVTPLLTFNVDHLGGKDENSKGRVKMRFWIDSNWKPCMSDVSVAVSYEFLARNLRTAPQQSTLEGFTKTFQPYDGSRRYYFVDGYFGDTSKRGFKH